jgi:alginate O-acetyltransferase complex protein AlgJ
MKKNANTFLIISFLVLLIVPVTVQLFNLDEGMNTENRKKADAPRFEITKINNFINEFDSYYKENFGFRDLLFQSYSDFKFEVFHESPLPDKGIVGKDGWLFLGNAFGDGMKESLGIVKLNEKEVKELGELMLTNKKYLDSLNIKFYVTLPPNKQTVYPEYLPYSITPQVTKLDQFQEEMKKYPEINMIDLKKFLLSKKDSTTLYYKTDTHWNQLGAFLAYQEIMKYIVRDFPQAKALTLKDFTINKTTGFYSLDIARMMNQKEEDLVYDFKPVSDSEIEKVDSFYSIPKHYIGRPKDYENHYKNPGKPLKVVIFRDSFSGFLIKYFKLSFGEIECIWEPTLRKDVIEREKPDIVILEVIEREIDLMQEKNF